MASRVTRIEVNESIASRRPTRRGIAPAATMASRNVGDVEKTVSMCAAQSCTAPHVASRRATMRGNTPAATMVAWFARLDEFLARSISS